MPSLPVSTENADSQYSIDKELYDSTLGIRDEMNLVVERLNKMDEHKSEVSEAVYFKVKSDYLAKSEQVQKSFEAKKLEIKKALQGLYQKQKEQDAELQKHKEVLEEAKFRSFLGEFTDKKFKEIETRENTGIKRFENILSLLQNNIKQYEDLIGGPAPEIFSEPPLPAPKTVMTEMPVISVKTPPVIAPPLEENPSPAAPREETPALPTPKTVINEEEPDDDFYADLGGEYYQAEESKAPEGTESRRTTSKTKAPESSVTIPIERLKTEKIRPIKATDHDEPVTSKNEIKEETPPVPTAKSAPKTQAGMAFDDSISSILRSIPLEDEEEEPQQAPKAKAPPPSATEEPPSLTHVEEKSTKPILICIEGELDPGEIELGENTSMGRSPSNDIVLKEAKVSRQHAAINFLHGNYVLVDLKSSNGVFVNGQKIEEHALQDGDEISVGSFRMLFRSRA